MKKLAAQITAAALVSFAVVALGPARGHWRPGTEHNRVHAVYHAFCGDVNGCRRGNEAVRVFNCESPNLWPWSRNGQYLGFAQMGDWARGYVASKGVPWTWGVWQQARAAAQLHRDLGWSQWSCAWIVGVL